MGELGTDSFLARPEREMFRVGFMGKGTEMVIYFGSVPSLLFCMFGNFLSLPPLCPWIVVNGPDVFCGMAGYLVSTVLVGGPLGQLLLGSWLVVDLERSPGAYPVGESTFWTPLALQP